MKKGTSTKSSALPKTGERERRLTPPAVCRQAETNMTSIDKRCNSSSHVQNEIEKMKRTAEGIQAFKDNKHLPKEMKERKKRKLIITLNVLLTYVNDDETRKRR